jgi:hypothetical protein
MLATDAVETAKIKNANVTNDKLASGIDATKLADGTVTNTELQYIGTLTSDAQTQIDALSTAGTTNNTAITAINTLDDGKIYLGNASNVATEVTPTGDVTITNTGVTAIGTSKVVTGMLATDAVTTAKITNSNVTTAKIADANVTYAKIQNVSATDKVLGRVSTGAGVIEEIATTGSGDVVRSTSPTLVTPVIGAATGTSLSVSGQLTSTVATGTAPLVVTSTTPVANLSIGGNAATATNIAGGALGSVPYQSAAGTTALLSGNTTATPKYLTSTGDGTAAAVPTWTSLTLGSTNLDGLTDAKVEGTNFSGSMILGHQTTGTLSNATVNTAVGIGAMSSITQGDMNVAVGYNALKNVTTGETNNAFGHEAMFSTTTGYQNVGIGSTSLYSNTSGFLNTSMGYQSLRYNTTGNSNVGIGSESMLSNTTGNNNSALGSRAMQYSSTGGQNVSLGFESLRWNTSGSSNTGTGYRALINNVTGNYNTAIGSDADISADGLSNATAIGAMAIVNASNTIQLGNTSVTAVKTTGKLTTGAVTFPNTDGTNGQVLITDGSGIASWSTPTGVTTMAAIGSTPNANGASISGTTLTLQPANSSFGGVVTTGVQTISGAKTFSSDITVNENKFGRGAGSTGSRNIAIGINPLNSNTTGTWNTAVGAYALQLNTTSSSNTAIGNEAISNAIPGNNNTGIGSRALMNTTGSSNTAVGSNALLNASTGVDNTAIGKDALQGNTTGSNNIGIGVVAGANTTTGDYNIAIGKQALQQNTTGSTNIAVGAGAIDFITTGNYNTVLGGFAGRYAGTGNSTNTTTLNNSMLLGYDTRPKLNSDSNEIVIGNSTVGNGSNTTTIGNSATTDTYIYGNLNVTGQIKLNNAVLSKSATYSFLTTDNANLLVFTGSTAGQTITLPSAVTVGAGREITIKNIASVSVSVASAGGTLISDSTTTAATTLALGIEPSNNWIKAISDGTNWIILRGLF